MDSIIFDSTKDRYLISIDKNTIEKDQLLKLIDNLRLEFLAQKVDFDASIEDLGEEIKESWWRENKDRFIPKEEQ